MKKLRKQKAKGQLNVEGLKVSTVTIAMQTYIGNQCLQHYGVRFLFEVISIISLPKRLRQTAPNMTPVVS